jgi:hypothetical protein
MNRDLIPNKYYNGADHMRIAIEESLLDFTGRSSSSFPGNINTKSREEAMSSTSQNSSSTSQNSSSTSQNVDIRSELKRRHELRYNQEQVFNNFEKRREEINRNEHNQDRKINNNKKLINGHII